MAVPDKSQFARDFLGPRLKRFVDKEETRAHSFAALNAGCLELRKTDRNWGLLEKTGGAHVRQRAADIWLYDLGNGTAQVVDVIGDAEGEDGVPVPSWAEKDLRPILQWRVPYDDVIVEPPPPPPPPPPDDHTEILQRLADAERRLAEADRKAERALAEVTMARAMADASHRRLDSLRLVPDEQADAVNTSRSFGHGHAIRAKVVG